MSAIYKREMRLYFYCYIFRGKRCAVQLFYPTEWRKQQCCLLFCNTALCLYRSHTVADYEIIQRGKKTENRTTAPICSRIAALYGLCEVFCCVYHVRRHLPHIIADRFYRSLSIR